jgi:uncharacterized membrane protein YcjF (UPF0283 family)
MNQRYQGDGPGGQTRKSAARAKPVSQAAATVHVKKKPQTDSEKRMARKAREKEQERRARKKARRKAAKAQAAGVAIEATAPAKPKGFFSKLLTPPSNMPQTEEYRKWRRLYWILLGVGIVCIISSFIYQTVDGRNQVIWWVSIITSYAVIIAAFIVDLRKVKPLVKLYQKHGAGNKSPKQLKHEQESKERATAIEAARKAERDTKKLSRRRKSSDTIVPGDEE